MISVIGFICRWAWLMWREQRPKHRLVRTLPHILDTLLLASGIYLAVLLQISLSEQSWLAAKLVGLVLYILLASFSYRSSISKKSRIIFFLMSLLVFGWMVSVAITKQVTGLTLLSLA